MKDCIFCNSNFPTEDQLISDEPDSWLFVYNINPQTDYHCMVVLKKEVFLKRNIAHVDNIGDSNLPDDILKELGIVLNRACRSIRCGSESIDKVLIASLNTGKGSSHLHFHLIPKRKDEKIRTVHDPDKEGGGLFFMARKEIVVDTFGKYMDSICGDESDRIKGEIKAAKKRKIKANVELLRKNFNWDK